MAIESNDAERRDWDEGMEIIVFDAVIEETQLNE